MLARLASRFLARHRDRGQAAQIIRHAYLRYHRGEIDHATLTRVIRQFRPRVHHTG